MIRAGMKWLSCGSVLAHTEEMEMGLTFPDNFAELVAQQIAEAPAPPADPSDRNCLSYWFPKLGMAGVPVPKTVIVDAGGEWYKMCGFADGPKHKEEVATAETIIDSVAADIRMAAGEVGGFPLFLRTGHFSGKHDWGKTCSVPNADSVASHVRNLVYMSEMFGSFGELPYRLWCVREMLPTRVVAELPQYGGMPLAREWRFFVRDGAVACIHPYWPTDSIQNGLSDKDGEIAREHFHSLYSGEVPASVTSIATKVAVTFANDGAWSVDLLDTERGWFVTDMAEAWRSFHWESCPNAKTM